MSNSFSENGYVIIKKAITPKTIKYCQKEILNATTKQKKNLNLNNYKRFCQQADQIKTSEFDFCKNIFEYLEYKKVFNKILNEKKLYNSISSILGKDLAFLLDGGVLLNLPNKSDPKLNYLFKDWHQEIWSGASVNSLQMWTPMFQKSNTYGQMELMCKSHTFGMIPNRNRKPTLLPKKYKTVKLNLEVGDCILFSTLLLHRSMPTLSTRLALAYSIKNFKFKDNNVFDNKSWKVFSYSEMTKIERKLGNSYLTPYRVEQKVDIDL